MIYLTNRNKIILHLGRYANVQFNEYNMPHVLTQRGIADSLMMSPAQVSILMKGICKENIAECRYAHVKGMNRRLRIYTLTPEGMQVHIDVSDALTSGGMDVRAFFVDPASNKTVSKCKALKARNEIDFALETLDLGKMSEAVVHLTIAIQHIVRESKVTEGGN